MTTRIILPNGEFQCCETCKSEFYRCQHFEALCNCPTKSGVRCRIDYNCVFCVLYNNNSIYSLFPTSLNSLDIPHPRTDLGATMVRMGISHGYSEKIKLYPLNYDPINQSICEGYQYGFKLGEYIVTQKKWNVFFVSHCIFLCSDVLSIVQHYVMTDVDAYLPKKP